MKALSKHIPIVDRILLRRGLLSARHHKRFLHSGEGGYKVGTCNSVYTELEFPSGESSKFNNLFLRDACTSAQSVEANSKQKFFSTAEVEDYCRPSDMPEINEIEGTLEISWFQGNGVPPHQSSYDLDFLADYSTQEGRRRGKYFDTKQTMWNLSSLDQKGINFQFDAYMKDEAQFYNALKMLNKYGFIFINDIPPQADHKDWFVETIATRIGYLRETFYGRLFDVKSIPKAKNIAYTNLALPLHMDLLYYEAPPGLQLLHSIKNKSKGGESVFCDSFQAAKLIKERDPPAYLALKTVPIPYHYNNNNEYYYHTHPLIVEDETYTNLNGEQPFEFLNYSPQFQAPFDCKEIIEYNNNYSILKDFMRGFKMFETLINSPENQLALKLPENSCVIFNNRRVLHSRKAFELSDELEERWLKGCYLDTDTFMSRLRVYYEKYK